MTLVSKLDAFVKAVDDLKLIAENLTKQIDQFIDRATEPGIEIVGHRRRGEVKTSTNGIQDLRNTEYFSAPRGSGEVRRIVMTSPGARYQLTTALINSLPIPPQKRRVTFYDYEVPNFGVRVTNRPAGVIKHYVLNAYWPEKSGEAADSQRSFGNVEDMNVEDARELAKRYNALIEKGQTPFKVWSIYDASRKSRHV